MNGTFRFTLTNGLWLVPLLAMMLDSGCGPESSSDLEENTVKLLACNPVTGTLSFLGPALEHSMELAVDEINAQGGVLDKPLELIHANTHSNVEDGLQEVEYYYQKNLKSIMAFVGSSLTDVSKSIYKIANDDADYGEKIPFVSPAATTPEFSEMFDNNDLFFRTVPSSKYQASILAKKAESLGYKKGLVLYIDDQFGEILSTAFLNNFREIGTATTVPYSDFSSQAIHTLLLEKKPLDYDFIFLIAYGDDGKVILGEWAKNYSQVPLLLSDTLVSDYFFSSLDPVTLEKINKAQINGIVSGVDETNQDFRSFAHRFCQSYPEDCLCPGGALECDQATVGIPAIYTANAYDAIYLLALAIQKTGQAHPDALKRGQINGTSTWDIKTFSQNIHEVANQDDDPSEVTVAAGQWSQALTALKQNKAINLEGISSSPFEFDSQGDPKTCIFLFWTVQSGAIAYTNSEGEKEMVVLNL